MDLSRLQSLLFVPANRPERFAKALACGVDAVIVDLEDAVAEADKEAARKTLQDWLPGQPAGSVLARINASASHWFSDDLVLCQSPAVAAVVVPKAELATGLKLVADITGKRLLPIIESALGLANVAALAKVDSVARLLFGKLDLAVDLGMDYPAPPGEDDDELVFLMARSQLVLASRCADLPPPIDGVFTAMDDPQGLERYVRRGMRLGFGGMLLIHPAQLTVMRQACMPSTEQLAWAEKVLAASQRAAGGATTLDGAMVDAPVVLRAQRLLERAQR
jgi:citrate lyase beta subunit